MPRRRDPRRPWRERLGQEHAARHRRRRGRRRRRPHRDHGPAARQRRSAAWRANSAWLWCIRTIRWCASFRSPRIFCSASWMVRQTLAGKRQWAAKQLAPYELGISPDALVGQLSASQRQFLEIVKALAANPKVLLLDEPTSSLDISGVEKLSEHHPPDCRGGRGGGLCQPPPAGDPRACQPRHHSARRRRPRHLRGQRAAVRERPDRSDGRTADRGGISRAVGSHRPARSYSRHGI